MVISFKYHKLVRHKQYLRHLNMFGKIEINTALRLTCFSNLKVLDITITTETLLINSI